MTDQLFSLAGELSIEAAAKGKPLKLRILAYNGGSMHVEGWRSPVIIDLAGLKLPDNVPILADHENKLGAVIASGRPEIHGGKLYIVATLANTEPARHIVELIRAGVVPEASVGVQPTETERLREG
ncbi:MAG: hypothetical protein KAY37_03665 [Phycisphaerae bacterium]|nr:hypothetical protein [Phycisphaerae bacterium]